MGCSNSRFYFIFDAYCSIYTGNRKDSFDALRMSVYLCYGSLKIFYYGS